MMTLSLILCAGGIFALAWYTGWLHTYEDDDDRDGGGYPS